MDGSSSLHNKSQATACLGKTKQTAECGAKKEKIMPFAWYKGVKNWGHAVNGLGGKASAVDETRREINGFKEYILTTESHNFGTSTPNSDAIRGIQCKGCFNVQKDEARVLIRCKKCGVYIH